MGKTIGDVRPIRSPKEMWDVLEKVKKQYKVDTIVATKQSTSEETMRFLLPIMEEQFKAVGQKGGAATLLAPNQERVTLCIIQERDIYNEELCWNFLFKILQYGLDQIFFLSK